MAKLNKRLWQSLRTHHKSARGRVEGSLANIFQAIYLQNQVLQSSKIHLMRGEWREMRGDKSSWNIRNATMARMLLLAEARRHKSVERSIANYIQLECFIDDSLLCGRYDDSQTIVCAVKKKKGNRMFSFYLFSLGKHRDDARALISAKA